MSEIADILRCIADRRRERIAEEIAAGPCDTGALHHQEKAGDRSRDFLGRLRSARGRAVIAEIKRGSPRLGNLAGVIDPESQARVYATNGASCISVVVEPDFFFGSYELVTVCGQASGLPVLAKDFVLDEIQLDWALRAGASAVLLIAAMLAREELFRLAAAARQRGLVPLVECHSEGDLAMLEGGEWELIGINNRDLRTFEVNLQRSIDLVPHLPPTALKVAESGIRSSRDVRDLAAAGFDAFLIGESLLLAADVGGLLRELVGPGDQR